MLIARAAGGYGACRSRLLRRVSLEPDASALSVGGMSVLQEPRCLIAHHVHKTMDRKWQAVLELSCVNKVPLDLLLLHEA